jgi:CHAD domain-containing protein
VGRKALRTQLRHLRESVALVYETGDIEDIHQMRVATRRLRTMARLLEDTPAFRRKQTSRLRKRLRSLARRLGAVRDLDILLAGLDEYERASVGTETSQPASALRETLLQRREQALANLRRLLRRPALLKRLRRARRTVRRLRARDTDDRQTLVRHVAGSALWQRYETVLRFEEAVAGGASTEQLHALRIACKQLRYALELFTDDADPCGQSLIETLKDAQDHLGALQDSVFAVTLLMRLRRDLPHNAFLEGFRAAQETRRDALRQEFAPQWERISGAQYRERLALLIAAL